MLSSVQAAHLEGGGDGGRVRNCEVKAPWWKLRGSKFSALSQSERSVQLNLIMCAGKPQAQELSYVEDKLQAAEPGA